MRYKVEKGSVSGHCCFEYSVMDTESTDKYAKFSAVCECYTEEDADRIARLLNSDSEGHEDE
jgi:hypothetical protein